jgi:hypothetical protein
MDGQCVCDTLMDGHCVCDTLMDGQCVCDTLMDGQCVCDTLMPHSWVSTLQRSMLKKTKYYSEDGGNRFS